VDPFPAERVHDFSCTPAGICGDGVGSKLYNFVRNAFFRFGRIYAMAMEFTT